MKLYIVITAEIKTHHSEEIGKRFREGLKKYPRNAKGSTLIASFSKRTPEGMRTVTIVEPQEGKLEEEYRHTLARQSMYDDIEGYDFTIDVCPEIPQP